MRRLLNGTGCPPPGTLAPLFAVGKVLELTLPEAGIHGPVEVLTVGNVLLFEPGERPQQFDVGSVVAISRLMEHAASVIATCQRQSRRAWDVLRQTLQAAAATLEPPKIFAGI